MALSKNRIKYINSLKIKKIRDAAGQFIIEGDKIIRDLLTRSDITISQIIASASWLEHHHQKIGKNVKEIIEAGEHDLSHITSFETPPPVMAIMQIPAVLTDLGMLAEELSIGLDCIQDPGNLGTIIRTADWFGIRNIICSNDSADCYNPKAIQSSMGAIININIHYAQLTDILQKLSVHSSFSVCGTYMEGENIFAAKPVSKGIILFGNEARGLSSELEPFIQRRLTIPSFNSDKSHVESLNVASAVAVASACVVRKNSLQ